LRAFLDALRDFHFTGYLCTRTALEGDTTIGIIVVEAGKAVLAQYSFRPADGGAGMIYRGQRAAVFTCADALCPGSQLELHALKDLSEARKALGRSKEGGDLSHLLDNFFRDRPELPEDRTGTAAKGASRPCPPQRPDPMDSIKDIIVQHHRRISEQGARKAGRQELEIDIVEGESYLVEEQGRELSYGMFASMVDDDYQGIGITRTNPRLLRSRTAGAKPRLLWLTEHESATEETVPPSLEKIMAIVEEFILDNQMSVVLVDDLQYLISCNNFEGAVRFIRSLVDKVSERSAVFLLSVDPNSLSVQERAVLEREMSVVRDRQ
jgi:hypothetical protein